MKSDGKFAPFEDFNEPIAQVATAARDEVSDPVDDIGDLQSEAWTSGYLAARRTLAERSDAPTFAARLLTSVHELQSKTSEAVEAASLVVAELLTETVIAAASRDWSADLSDRIETVMDKLKPALTVVPELMLSDQSGAATYFDTVSQMSRAMEETSSVESILVRWPGGEASINRSAFIEDIRSAISPLYAGRQMQQSAGKKT